MIKCNTGYLKTLEKPKKQDGDRLDCLCMSRLPLGEISCGGWLRGQLDLMTDGMTGRLPEYGPFFKENRNGFLYPETHSGWEEIPYWFRGFYPLAVLTGNKRLLDTAQTYIEALIASHQSDGWFGPAHLKTADTVNGEPVPDLFPAMLLTEPLIQYYEHTGDERVFRLLGDFFAFCRDIPDKTFLPAKLTVIKWQKIRAGDMLPALYWYYDRTKESWVADLARRFYNGIFKSSFEYVAHHAVDFAQRFAYDGIYSRLSGDKAHFRKTEYQYDLFSKVWGQMPRGIFAADEQIRPGCTDPRQAYEPCGMVELAKNFYELGRISSDTVYADRTEDVMLNHFPASFSPDYREMHYLTSANMPIQSNGFYHQTYNGSHNNRRSFQIMTPNNRCCGHNTGMGWPFYAMNLWQKSADGGLVAWLYAESKVKTTLDGHNFELEENTDYPFDGSVSAVVVKNEVKQSVPLYFRVPQWSRKVTVGVNGETVYSGVEAGGFVCVSSDWNAGDKITVEFKMDISLTEWQNNGSVSADMGPLTYSVKIGEEWKVVPDGEAGDYNHPVPHLWENYEILPTSPWNYGLPADSYAVSDLIKVLWRTDRIANQPFTPENAPITLLAKAHRIPGWQLQDETASELCMSPVRVDTDEEEIELIPLGCARLRISCFPVVTDSPSADEWKQAPKTVAPENRPKSFCVPYIAEYPKEPKSK